MRITGRELRQIIRETLIREELTASSLTDAGAIAVFEPFDSHIAFVAYDRDSLDAALAGEVKKPTVHAALYVYDWRDPQCNSAYQVSLSGAATPRSGWGTLVYLAAMDQLGALYPDRHSLSPSAQAAWKSMARRGLITGTPLPPHPCLGDPVDGIRGYRDADLNMSYSLAGPTPALVTDLLQRGGDHMAYIAANGDLEDAHRLLIWAAPGYTPQ